MIFSMDNYGNTADGDGAHLTIFMEEDGAHAVVSSVPFSDLMKEIVPVGASFPNNYAEFETALHSTFAVVKSTVMTFKCASMQQIMSPGSPYRQRGT